MGLDRGQPFIPLTRSSGLCCWAHRLHLEGKVHCHTTMVYCVPFFVPLILLAYDSESITQVGFVCESRTHGMPFFVWNSGAAGPLPLCASTDCYLLTLIRDTAAVFARVSSLYVDCTSGKIPAPLPSSPLHDCRPFRTVVSATHTYCHLVCSAFDSRACNAQSSMLSRQYRSAQPDFSNTACCPSRDLGTPSGCPTLHVTAVLHDSMHTLEGT